ncbi:CoA-disulfide reductase [Pelosinus fermentans]|uniref:CoA-disulfide reductase n=1 Tax=Pelosinus fermentans JBW45 TaxID=1192197 RepID=I8TSS8_9FIRM|nr:CoA-disulfide reductase [Pelosinus fermentans]AJQ29082.1 CoA-disulfide reductase [Pelosinus fermentans JBW45]
MSKKVLIIGGVAGGASAAARLRRLDEHAQIILLERDEHISFANCGLPYYIGETIQDREKLLVQTPKGMQDRFNIDVRVNSEVTALHPERKTVTIHSTTKGIYEESYDALILSPGAKPIKPPIPGIDSKKIFTLRNIPDTDRIKKQVDLEDIQRAVVIGGGYIGVEMAENLKERGMEVTLVEAAPHILAPFDSDMVAMMEKELEENGVRLLLNDGVKAFQEKSTGLDVVLSSGTTLTADLVILAIGVAPDTSFVKESGIQLGARGHILVNDHMETSIPDIYAVGDAIEVKDFVNEQGAAIPLAGPANKQGRIVADNIAGISSTFKGTQGTSIIKVFSLTGATTGNNERNLKRLGLPYQVVYVHPFSHATYYPGALQLSLKLLFNGEGRILGAQGIGIEGIDKSIDVIATTMRLSGTIYDLTELELAYAPPYSSAKDPVNMLGFAAENILAKRTEVFTYETLQEYDQEHTILLDVRSPLEFANGHLDGAINIPLDTLRQRLSELDKDKLILAYCKMGLQGYLASRILRQNGFKVKNMTGGFKSASIFFPSQDTPNSISNQIAPAASSTSFDRFLDACGLSCPGPLMQLKSVIDEMKENEILQVTASDPGFTEDVKAWCLRTHNSLLDLSKNKGIITALIKKGSVPLPLAAPVTTQPLGPAKDNKTIVVFSGDLDKAMAAFIIANGAASMGKKVTLFFTFWGLNILRKPERIPVKKGFMDKMFGFMMPRGSKALKLSNMNMLGMGTQMMRMVMKNKNVSSLEELIQSAMAAGIEIVACQMSLDVMGLKQEELLDGVKVGGVGYYLSEAEDSNVNLFI